MIAEEKYAYWAGLWIELYPISARVWALSWASMAFVDAACAGRAGEGLHFQNVVRGRDGAILSVGVCLRVPRLEARSRVSANYAAGFDDLVAFFRQLAVDWRGWDGERTYDAGSGGHGGAVVVWSVARGSRGSCV
jgi:hypothetical protein